MCRDLAGLCPYLPGVCENLLCEGTGLIVHTHVWVNDVLIYFTLFELTSSGGVQFEPLAYRFRVFCFGSFWLGPS